MRFVLLVSVFAAVATAGLAGSSSAAIPAPTGLHGFLLVANEAPTTTFHSTPSFAWKPVSGADRYELQLSIGSTFHDNGILYDDKSLLTPVAAPPLTLPWITGSPHSLYARVRALFGSRRASPWSEPYGFDVVPPAPATPLASLPGLLRWTRVEGADSYEVWLLDKTPVTKQIEVVRTNVLDERDFGGVAGAVRWRVRAMRWDVNKPHSGLPVATYGPWSPVYRSTNSAPTTGPIMPTATASDVISSGMTPSHQVMPGFAWTGDETLDGTPAAFFRVYVFTDNQCLNPVFVSPAVPSPAYAPRLNGSSLELPVNAANVYIDPGRSTLDAGTDGNFLTPAINEQMPAATPTVGPATTVSDQNGTGVIGPPVDLWDDDVAQGSGYYWTVVGVQPVAAGIYQDLELPQDVCAAGRVQRLVISSAPSLTAGSTPYATGLSSKGRLVSAAETPKFYGEPLVAWTAAPGATAYEIQWAKHAYPFDPRESRFTFATSAVLPLKPGTWWYRVRGIDFNLSGTQAMSWSQPTKIVVTAPRFRVTSVHRTHRRFKVRH